MSLKEILSFFRKSRMEDANEELFAEIQKHWPDQKLAIGFLIAERWQAYDAEPGHVKSRYDYLVFIDKDGDLDWLCNDDNSSQKLNEATTCLIAMIMDAEAYPVGKLSKADRHLFKRMLGSAIVSAFEDGHDAAMELLSEATRFLQDRVNEKSRQWTLICAACFGAAALALSSYIKAEPARHAVQFGMFGAYFSIVRRSGRRLSDANAGFILHALEVGTRVSIGMIMGIVASALAGCDAAPGMLRSSCENPLAMRVVCFAAGLFDGLVPSLISQYIITKPKEEGQ